jgi:hypothetical protein
MYIFYNQHRRGQGQGLVVSLIRLGPRRLSVILLYTMRSAVKDMGTRMGLLRFISFGLVSVSKSYAGCRKCTWWSCIFGKWPRMWKWSMISLDSVQKNEWRRMLTDGKWLNGYINMLCPGGTPGYWLGLSVLLQKNCETGRVCNKLYILLSIRPPTSKAGIGPSLSTSRYHHYIVDCHLVNSFWTTCTMYPER